MGKSYTSLHWHQILLSCFSLKNHLVRSQEDTADTWLAHKMTFDCCWSSSQVAMPPCLSGSLSGSLFAHVAQSWWPQRNLAFNFLCQTFCRHSVLRRLSPCTETLRPLSNNLVCLLTLYVGSGPCLYLLSSVYRLRNINNSEWVRGLMPFRETNECHHARQINWTLHGVW